MYGKYFASTFTGSMVGAGSVVFAVWGYVIANCRDGSVELNPKLLAMILGDTPTKIQEAVDFLCSPDPESRTKEKEGRRMIHSGAFLYDVPNHSTYRKILNEDERREYFRVKKQEERQRKKALTSGQVGQSKTVKDMSTVSTQSEADPESDPRKELRSCSEAEEPPTEPLLIFQCDGDKREWGLTKDRVIGWQASFPALDVMQCCREARQWLLDNPTKRKTFTGMPAYLGRWMGRAQNTGQNQRIPLNGNGHKPDAPRGEFAKPFSPGPQKPQHVIDWENERAAKSQNGTP